MLPIKLLETFDMVNILNSLYLILFHVIVTFCKAYLCIFSYYDVTISTIHTIKNQGQGKNPKLPVSSYFHIYGWWVILG